MRKIIPHFFALLSSLILVTITFAQSGLQVNADAAPEPPPVGSDLFPAIGTTHVRMISEYVLIDIAGSSSYPSGHADVTAQFFMRNLGDVTEQMRVRFPMNHAYYDLDEELQSGEDFCNYSPSPSLEGIQVWVDEVESEVEISFERMIDYMASPDDFGNAVYITVPCWAHFNVIFPPGQDVLIKVAYTVPGYSYTGYGAGSVEFAYVIGTGAGWADTIGKADIVARLPYDANDLNVVRCFPENCKRTGKEISWHFEDFEPDGNVVLDIMRPEIWQKILEETLRVQEIPNDGEAWGYLAKAYKEGNTGGKGIIYGYDERSTTLFDLSAEAYQKAVDLLPNDADWHYGYAYLLCNKPLWGEPTYENWRACILELKQALDLEPDHEMANDLLERIDGWGSWQDDPIEVLDLSGDKPVYLILTHTQGPTPTSTKTAPPTPTRTKRVKTSTPTLQITNTPIEPTETASATPEPEATHPPEPTDKPKAVPTEAITVIPRDVNTAYIHFGFVLVLMLGVMVAIHRYRERE